MWLALMIPILSLSGILIFFAGTGLDGTPSLLSLAVLYSAFLLAAVLVVAQDKSEETTTEVGIDDKDGLYASTTVDDFFHADAQGNPCGVVQITPAQEATP